jgi:hypothetical protein
VYSTPRRNSEPQILYGRTPQGQLLYDLAFTNLSVKYLARKHRFHASEIRQMREVSAVKKLRRQNHLPVKV